MLIAWTILALLSLCVIAVTLARTAKVAKMGVIYTATEHPKAVQSVVAMTNKVSQHLHPTALRHYTDVILAAFFSGMRKISQILHGYFHIKTKTYTNKVIETLQGKNNDGQKGAVSFGLRKISLDK